jgi:hypothetical protein
MASTEFFTSVKKHLVPDGVLTLNMNMVSDKKGSINEALSDTIASIFPYVYTYVRGNTTNKELYASVVADLPAKLDAALPKITDTSLRNEMTYLSTNLVTYADTGIRLTDDKANVEQLSADAVDEIIGSELIYYRHIYEERGFWGFIQYLLS